MLDQKELELPAAICLLSATSKAENADRDAEGDAPRERPKVSRLNHTTAGRRAVKERQGGKRQRPDGRDGLESRRRESPSAASALHQSRLPGHGRGGRIGREGRGAWRSFRDV